MYVPEGQDTVAVDTCRKALNPKMLELELFEGTSERNAIDMTTMIAKTDRYLSILNIWSTDLKNRAGILL